MARPKAAKTTSQKTSATNQESTSRKGRKPIPENETREDKLVRLAEARVSKACKYIGLIGNLAAYKPNGEQIEQIMQALGMACARVNNRLDGVKGESIVFSLHKQ